MICGGGCGAAISGRLPRDRVGLRSPSTTIGCGTLVFGVAATAARWSTLSRVETDNGPPPAVVELGHHLMGIEANDEVRDFNIFRREQDRAVGRVFTVSKGLAVAGTTRRLTNVHSAHKPCGDELQSSRSDSSVASVVQE